MKLKAYHVIIALAIITVLSLSFYSTLNPSKPWSAWEDDDPSIGPMDAKVHILEFSDFQCSACATVHPVMKQILDYYGDEIRFIFRDYPLSYHQNAQLAAEAAGCADEQGKYWEYHDTLFSKRMEWVNVTDANDVFVGYATDLGLDGDRFDQCLKSGTYATEVSKDYEDGTNYGVPGTPTFFILQTSEGKWYMMTSSYGYSFEIFQQIIDEELD